MRLSGRLVGVHEADRGDAIGPVADQALFPLRLGEGDAARLPERSAVGLHVVDGRCAVMACRAGGHDRRDDERGDQSLPRKLPQAGQLRSELLLGSRAEIDEEVAHDLRDNAPPPHVYVSQEACLPDPSTESDRGAGRLVETLRGASFVEQAGRLELSLFVHHTGKDLGGEGGGDSRERVRRKEGRIGADGTEELPMVLERGSQVTESHRS
jgi:hypothetical protein